MRWLDPRNGPAWDLPAVPRVGTWVVASTPRTGSTLLCRAIWDAGGLGAPKEYLNPMQIRDWEVRRGHVHYRLLSGPGLALAGRWGPRRRAAHLRDVIGHRTGASGWFGMKVHRHHWASWFGPLDADLLLGPITWVRLVRRDQVAQAVSWARAVQTGRWASHQGRGLPPVYSRRRIERALARIRRAEADWEGELRARGVQPLRLVYEDVVADLPGAVRAVYEHLGVDAPSDVPAPGLRRQRDATSAAWQRRFVGSMHA